MIGEIDGATFDRIRNLIRSETGISLRDSKKILVINRLRKRLQSLNIDSYEEYYKILESKTGHAAEMQFFIDAISTNETYFYRGIEQIEALRSAVLPKAIASRRIVNIWCAGSSSGEEPYTILMVANEVAEALKWPGRIRLIATDINSSVLEVARRGVYSGKSLRDLPELFLKRYFSAEEGGKFTVNDDLKRMVEFRIHNLLKDDPPAPEFDIIFCRNVLMYFERNTQETIVAKQFAPVLTADGFLFIGNSESFVGLKTSFTYAGIKRCPIYTLRESAGGLR